MSVIKTIAAVFGSLLVISFAVGCDAGKNNANGINIVEAGSASFEWPVGTPDAAAAKKAAYGANDFAFRLSAALANDIGTENFVCSPYSVWLPLAALVNAADAANKESLLSAIGAAGLSEADINGAASRMLYSLTNQQAAEEYGSEYNTNPLKTANAIFVGNNVTLRKDFAKIFAKYYGGSAINVDFASEQAVDAVNKWASDNTDGLITNIIDGFDPNTVAAIANALYFSDRWQWRFDPEKTAPDVFYSPAGEQKAFFMLREGDNQTYYEDDLVQAMPLYFLSRGGMYIILPKDGDAAGLLSSMTSEYFSEIQQNSVKATGKLLLPRFTIDSGVIRLSDTLAALGVPLFDEKSAPLTGGLLEDDMPVWLSSAVQKAVIEVDEKGTTAAAVTVISAPASAEPIPTEPFFMNCNSPFVFILYGYTIDNEYQVLFTGVVNSPVTK